MRVSHVGARENIVSPEDQETRIRAACRRDSFRLREVISELDVSGGTPLSRRAGLRRAVELVEAGKVDVIVVAYLDRLVRSLPVQLEVVQRVENAGGEVLTLDHGALTNGNAAQRLTGNMLGLIAEYQRSVTAERTQEAKERAVARGVPPFPNIPFWLRRGGEKQRGPLEHYPERGPLAAEAVRLRAEGATVREVRTFLAERGVQLSFHGVQSFLTSRLLLGELRFGASSNLEAFPPLVDVETFNRVQRLRLPRGRRPKSERLLACLGVLRCATCGSRMVIGFRTTRDGKRYEHYRCPPVGDCPQRVTIAADKAERAVEAEVRRLVAGMKGKASSKTGAWEAAREYECRQAELDRAIEVVLGAGLQAERSATERLAEFRQARDDALERYEELQSIDAPAVVLNVAADWDSLSLEGRRGIIKAVLECALVAPGRGDDRITFEARS